MDSRRILAYSGRRRLRRQTVTASAFAALFVVALAASLALRLWLAYRHATHVAARRDAVPAAFADRIALSAHRKAADYTVARTRLGAAETLAETVVLVALTLGGGLAALVAWTDVLPFGVMGRDLVLIVAVAVISGVVGLPFSYAQTFGIEVRFGFNRTTRALWLADLAKGILIGAVLGLPLAALVLWLMRAAGPLWWIWAWAAWIAFQFLLLALYPTVIAPLFNKFSPMPPGAARDAIEALLARCGFANRGLYVMDGSRRSSHGNAFFTGFGRAKRIVFFDTLLERLTPDEVEAVLAHELGPLQAEARAEAHALDGGLLARVPCVARLARGVALVLRRARRAAGAGPSGRRAAPVLPRAARVHVRAGAARVAVLAPARVRGRPRSPRSTRRRDRSSARSSSCTRTTPRR